MKTAVSLPDHLFDLAETAAKQLHLSRSELYSRAISEFLERYHAEDITARLNQIYAESPAGLDSDLHCAQMQVVRKESW